MSTWIVVPAYNEAESLGVFVPEMLTYLRQLGPDGRVIIIDDGSRDATPQVIGELQRDYPDEVLHRRFPRNRGKARALQLGFREAVDAGAEVVIMMDADGQDDETSLPRLVAELDNGYDLVTGARGVRQDRFVKRHTSKLYNGVTKLMTKAPGTDFNSGFKVMRAGVAAEIEPMMYGELHRYITVMAHWFGYRVGEVQVQHRPRQYGSTKYGLARFWRGFLDLITVRFLLGYESRPLHMFGMLSVIGGAIGSAALLYLMVLRFTGDTVGHRPLLIFGTVLVLGSLQLLTFGLLAELIVFTFNQLAGRHRHLPGQARPPHGPPLEDQDWRHEWPDGPQAPRAADRSEGRAAARVTEAARFTEGTERGAERVTPADPVAEPAADQAAEQGGGRHGR